METVLKSISASFIPAVLLIAFLMPFWYIALYLLHRKFFEASSQLLMGTFCFCLSFIWFSLFAVCALLWSCTKYGAPDPSIQSVVPLIEGAVSKYYFTTGGLAIITLSIIIVYYYFRIKHKPRSFTQIFASASAGVGLLAIIFALIDAFSKGH